MNYEQAYEKWHKQREQVYDKNSQLIKKWRSIPWYRFWEIPSFEEQRQTILENWNRLPPAPHL